MSRSTVQGPAVWYGPQMQDREVWTHRLRRSEVEEVTAAVAAVLAGKVDLVQRFPERIALPRLGRVLAEIGAEVVHGRGFAVLTGLPLERMSRKEATVAFWVMGTYLGRAVPQNAQGHLLGHVTDVGHESHNPLQRVYATRSLQPFHTDSCDVVALLCLKTARVGGHSSIVSSTTIYHEMLRLRPDLVEVLCRPFVVDRKGEVPAGKGEYYEMPVFHEFGGTLTTVFARGFIRAAQRHAEVPRLTPEQNEAMDLLEELAHSERLRLDMELRPGDLQVLHNHQILHARTAYEDHPKREQKRHLLRLWLSPPDGRPLPEVFAERYGTVEPGRRGGIRVPGVAEYIPFDPEYANDREKASGAS